MINQVQTTLLRPIPQTASRRFSISKLTVGDKDGKIPVKKLMTQPIKKKLSSLTPKSKIKIKTVKIRILSNWGNESLISCSELDLLDGKMTPIPILTYTLEPANTRPESMKLLWNKQLIKKPGEPIWKEFWPPPPPQDSITLSLSISEDVDVQMIRVWPNSMDLSANIRKVVVRYDNKEVYTGEFPNELGTIIKFDEFSFLKHKPNVGQSQVIERDIFGSIPVESTQEISIYPIDTYGKTAVFGLNRIIIFGSDCKPMSPNANKIISIINIDEANEKPEKLFRPVETNQQKYESDMYTCWSGELKPGSCIKIRYAEQFVITAIILLNPTIHADTPNIALRGAKIKFGNKLVWCGRVKERHIEEPEEIHSATYIFITPIGSAQESIKSVAFPARQSIKKKDRYEAFD